MIDSIDSYGGSTSPAISNSAEAQIRRMMFVAPRTFQSKFALNTAGVLAVRRPPRRGEPEYRSQVAP